MNLDHFAAYTVAVAEGDKAAVRRWEDRLVRDNRLLAMSLCNKFIGGLPERLPLEDAEQAAMIGLLRTIRKWDPTISKFSNLAAWWIRHEMQVACVNEDRLIEKLYGRKRHAAFRKINTFAGTHGRFGTPEEMGVKAEDFTAHQTDYRYVRGKGQDEDEREVYEFEDPEMNAEAALVAREEAYEALDAVPPSRPIPVWALAQRPAYVRATAGLPQEDLRLLEDLVKSGDTVAQVARRHRKSKPYVMRLCKKVEGEVRDFWHEGEAGT